MSTDVTAPPRERLLAAMADAIVEVGYGALTVADIVRLARVSKRTFYQEFADKADCLVALYETSSTRVVRAVEAATADVPSGSLQLDAGIAAYLAELQARPAVVRTAVIEILRAGPRGLAVRREVHRRYAALLVSAMQPDGRGGSPSPAVAMALVGGINELLLEALEAGGDERIAELGEPVRALLRPFLDMPDSARGG